MARSPRWTALKGAFSSFQHLGLLLIPRLSNFKEICLQNERIIVFTFFQAVTSIVNYKWQPTYFLRNLSRGDGWWEEDKSGSPCTFSDQIWAHCRGGWTQSGCIHKSNICHAQLSRLTSRHHPPPRLARQHRKYPRLCLVQSWKWYYLRLLFVLIAAITDAGTTKQAAIQTLAYLCTSLTKVYTISKQKQGGGNIHKLNVMTHQTVHQTELSVIHFLLFYLSSSVFTRRRHKGDGVHSTWDNMWITLNGNQGSHG